jgi:hypothetical protein
MANSVKSLLVTFAVIVDIVRRHRGNQYPGKPD